MKINEDLTQLDKKHHELYRASFRDLEAVLPSRYFELALSALVEAYRIRLAGELSSWRYEPLNKVIARLIQKCEEEMTIIGYHTDANVIGYGLPKDDKTRVNTRYLQGERADSAMDRAERGANIAHEKGHDAGFDHDYRPTSRRPNSLCYLIGTAYKQAHREMFADQYGTVMKPPRSSAKPIKVYRKKQWWRFW